MPGDINDALNSARKTVAENNYISDSLKRVEKNLSRTDIQDINTIYGSTNTKHLDFRSGENDRIAARQEAKAKAQGKWTQLGNSLFQGLWNEAIVGTVASIWDLAVADYEAMMAVNPLFAGFSKDNIYRDEDWKKIAQERLKTVYDNEIAKVLNEHQQYIREELAPIHRNEQTPLAFGEWGWWMENLPNAVSTLTLLIPAAGEAKAASYLGKGARMAINAAKGVKATRGLSKGFGISRATASALSKGSRNLSGKILESGFGQTVAGEKIASGLSTLGSRPNAVAKFLRGAEETGIQAFTSRTLENIQESREVYNEIKDDMKDKLSSMNYKQREEFRKNNTKNGKYIFDGMTDEEIASQVALESAQKTFIDDYQALIFDVAQFYALRRFLKPVIDAPVTRKIYNAQQRSLAGLNGSAAAEKTWLQWQKYKIGKAFGSPKDFAKSAFASAESASLFEMPEEMIQGINAEKGKEVMQHYINPNYIDRTYANYLSDPKIWDQGVWGILGGLIFQHGGRGLYHGSKKGYAELGHKAGWITDDAYNALLMTDEKSRVKNIEGRIQDLENYRAKMDLIEQGRNPYKRYINEAGEQYFDEEGNAFEFANEAEREALKIKATEEYVTKLALNAYDAGNAGLVMEYLKNEDFHKLLSSKGLKFSKDELNAGEFIQNTVENIFENYENNLVDVIENTDVDSDIIARMVARDLTLLQNRRTNNQLLLNEYSDSVNSDTYNTSKPANAQTYLDNYRKRAGINRLKQLINTKEFFRLWKEEGRITDERMAQLEEDNKSGKLTSERLDLYRQLYSTQQELEQAGHSDMLSIAGYNANIQDLNREIQTVINYLQKHNLLNYTETSVDEGGVETKTTLDYSNTNIEKPEDFGYRFTFSEALNKLDPKVRKIFDFVSQDAMFGDVTDEFKRKVANMVKVEMDGESYDAEVPIGKDDYKRLYDRYAYTMDRYIYNEMIDHTKNLMNYLTDAKSIEDLEDRKNRILNGQLNDKLKEAADALKVGYLKLLGDGKGNLFSDMVNSAYYSRRKVLLGEDENKKEREQVVTNQGTVKRRVEKPKQKEQQEEQNQQEEKRTSEPIRREEPIEEMREDEGTGEIEVPEVKQKPKEKKETINEGYSGEEEYDAALAATNVIEEAVDDILDENQDLVKEAKEANDPNGEAYMKLVEKIKESIEDRGIPYDTRMDNTMLSYLDDAIDAFEEENPDELLNSAMGVIGMSKTLNLGEFDLDERVEKLIEAYLKTVAEINHNGKRVVNVYKLMQVLLRDKNLKFDTVLRIVRNLQNVIQTNNKYIFIGINNDFMNNPRNYLRALAQSRNEGTIVNGLRINRPSPSTLDRLGYVGAKRNIYYRLRNKLLMDLGIPNAETNPIIKMQQNGKDSNSVRFIVEYDDADGNRQELEVGYIAAPTRTNHNKTYSITSANTGFNYSVTREEEGIYSANVDEFFNAVIFEDSEEAKEIRQICRDYAFRMRERIKAGISQSRFFAVEEDTAKSFLDNKLIKELLDKKLMTISTANSTTREINGQIISEDVNKATRMIQIVTDVLFKTDEDTEDNWKTDDAAADYILTATPEEVKRSYEQWKLRLWDQYDRSYKVIEKYNQNKEQNFLINMLNQIILRVNTGEEITNINEVIRNDTKNKLVYMTGDGSILDENGNNLGVSSRVNELAILLDTGEYIQADGYEPIMITFSRKNNISREGKLYNKLKQELIDIINSQFSNEDKSPNFDEIKRKLNSLFGIKGLFSGYKVVDFTKNGNRMLALATVGEKSVNILTFYENANNKGKTGLAFNPFGTTYNFIGDSSKTLRVGGVDMNAVELIASTILDGNIKGASVSTGTLFNTTFAIVKQNSDNEYIERKNGALYIMGEKYSSSLDFVMKEKAFGTHAKKNEQGSVIYGTPQYKTIYLDVDKSSEGREQEALKGTNIKLPKAGETVNTLDFLKQLGFREEYVKELMGYSTEDGTTTLPLLPEEFIFSGKTDRIRNKNNPLLGDFEGIYEHETGKIKISSLTALGNVFGQSRNARLNFVRVLLHEQLHKGLSVKGFAKGRRYFNKVTNESREIVNELLKIAQFAYDKIQQDISEGNNVGGLTVKQLEQIKNYLESVINKTGIYEGHDDFYVAEEFIVESMTRSSLLAYFNNTEYGNVSISNIENSKKTIWQKIFDNLLKILNRLGYAIGSIKDNTILARQYEIFGETFNKEVQEAETRSKKESTSQQKFEETGKVIEDKEKELTEAFTGWQQGETEEDWDANHVYVYIDNNGVHHKVYNSVTGVLNRDSNGVKIPYTGPEIAGPVGTEVDEYARLYFDANSADPDNVVTDLDIANGKLKYLDKLSYDPTNPDPGVGRGRVNSIMENIRQEIISKLKLKNKRFKIITNQTIVSGVIDINDKGDFNGKKLVAGTMDMIVLTEDGYYILDFKTSKGFRGQKNEIDNFLTSHPTYGKQVDLYEKFVDANTSKLGPCLGKYIIAIGVDYDSNLKYDSKTKRIISDDDVPFSLTGTYAVIDANDEKYGVKYEVSSFEDKFIIEDSEDFVDVEEESKEDNKEEPIAPLESPVEGNDDTSGNFIDNVDDDVLNDDDSIILDDEDISESKFIELDEMLTSEDVQSIFYDNNNEVVISNVEQYSSFNEFLMSVSSEYRPILVDLNAKGLIKFVC